MPADGAQEYAAMFLYTLNGFYLAVSCTPFHCKNHTLVLFWLWADPETDIRSICCLKGVLQSPNSLWSGMTKESRLSIGVILLVIFWKIIHLKMFWGWILSSFCWEGHWVSQSLNEPNIGSSCLYVREALLASYSFTIVLNIIPSRCKYAEEHNLTKSRRFPVFPHDTLHTRKHPTMWLHRLLSLETNKSQPLRKCTNIHQRQSCSRTLKLTMSCYTQWRKTDPAELMNHII